MSTNATSTLFDDYSFFELLDEIESAWPDYELPYCEGEKYGDDLSIFLKDGPDFDEFWERYDDFEDERFLEELNLLEDQFVAYWEARSLTNRLRRQLKPSNHSASVRVTRRPELSWKFDGRMRPSKKKRVGTKRCRQFGRNLRFTIGEWMPIAA